MLATGLLPNWQFLWAGPSTDESLCAMMLAACSKGTSSQPHKAKPSNYSEKMK